MTKPKQVICVASDCTNVLPEGRKKYCSDRCSNRIRRRATRANKKTTEFQSEKILDGAISERRGKYYAICKELGYFDKIISGEMTQQQVADAVSTSRANISRSLAAYYKDLEAERKQQQFKKVETKTSVEDFLNFRDTYFLTERGEPYDTPDFQQEWIKAILESIDTGGRLMILSPPRHGKTDLLTHFCVYVICRNPNIRVMWVGGNEDIAKNAVSSVLDHLEGNDKLIEDFVDQDEVLNLRIEAEKVGQVVNLLLQLEQLQVLSLQLWSQLEKEVKFSPETLTSLSQMTLRITQQQCNLVLERIREIGGQPHSNQEKRNTQAW